MKLHLCLFLSLLGTSLSTPGNVLSSSNCKYDDSTDTVDCSGVSSTDEVVAAMKVLHDAGHSQITNFVLKHNQHLSHLPQGMLGDMQFKYITITDNFPNLHSCSDILGASKHSVIALDLSNNPLSYLPRMESTSLKTYKQNGPSLINISGNALNAVPNLEVIELQKAGQGTGLVIFEGAFSRLPNLRELHMKDSGSKDFLATRGAFTFSSPHLKTVDIRATSPPMTKAEPGTFGGFNANTTLHILLNSMIDIESFYTVFKSGSQVIVQETQPCSCHMDWIKASCFLHQLKARCVYRQYYSDFQDLPDDHFSNCCFYKQQTAQ